MPLSNEKLVLNELFDRILEMQIEQRARRKQVMLGR